MTTGLRQRLMAGAMALCLVVLAACGGGGGSSSGGDGGASAGSDVAAPDGAVASDMQPQLNGWAFPNFPSATFPDLNFDTADLVSMFGSGPEVCVDGVAEPCTLTAEAAAWARMVNQARATGHCEGLVALASARFNKAELPETVKLPSQEDEIRAVMRAFATQFVPEVQQAVSKWTKASLADKVDELKKSFASDKLEYTLGVYVESGGHAILPYAVEYPTPDVARIMVYDSNWPGRNRYVDVDLKAETWSFSFAGDDPANDPNIWTGGAGDMDLTPFEAREGTCPFCGDDTKVQSTTMLVRTDNLDWSVQTPGGTVSPTESSSSDGTAARPVKGEVVITRLSPRATDRSSYDFMITIPNDVLENGSSPASPAPGKVDLPASRLDAFVSDGQAPTAVETTTTIPSTSTTAPTSAGSRAKLLFGGAASVFAVTPGGVAQFSTPGSKDKPVEVGARSIKSNDPNVDLTLAAGNLVANASGPTAELGASEEGSLAVQVTTASGEVIQQQVTPEAPAVQIKADETGGVTVLEATATGEVQKTEIAADGTKTETVVDASALNLNKVEVELPPALESKAIEALPKLEDRNLNNPNYKADEAYVAPTTTVPSAAGAKEVASGPTTTVAKAETPSTVQTRNAALPGSASSTLPVRNAALPTTTAPRSVTAAGATPTTVVAVAKPTLSGFRIATKTFGDDAFTIDPPDSNSPGGFRYASSKTDVATVNATTGRVTIVGAGSTVITATQAAARGFEAGTITATLIVAKATPQNSALKDITKTFGDDSFTIAKPTTDSTGAFTFTSSNEDVVKQSKTTGRWVITGAGKATITVSQASTDDFLSATDSLVVTVRKGTPELAAPADVSKAFLDADFDLPKPTSDSKGAFTYVSSDANIVSVTGNKASIKSAGTVTITASQAGTDDWVAASATYKVVVAPTAPSLSEFADASKTFGDDAFTLTAPKSNSSGAITYKSSDDKVVTVGEKDGKVTIIGAGSATITASQAATSGFSSGSISAKVTVAKAAPKISDLLVADKAFGDADFTLKPTSNSSTAFSYSTDKPAVFTVDAKTGLVKIVGVGTATLTAKQESNSNFESGSVAVSVSVSKGKPLYSWTIANKTFGDAAFDVNEPTSSSTGAITYKVDDATIASVTSAGRITILKAGTVTITASQVATDLHVAATTTATLTIDKLAPTLGTFTIPTKTFGDTPFTLTAPSSPSSGAFSFESVDTSSTVATVASNGLVTITAAGTLQIRARQATTTNYSAASIIATLTVNRASQQGVQTSGLVAKWSFDSANTLGVNSVGSGDLIQTGGPTWTASGKSGGALSLNGSAYLNLAQGASITGLPIGNSAYTQTAWFNASALGGRGIIGWGTYGASNQVTALRLFGSSGGFRHYWWGNDLDSGVTLQTGQWYHVAATFDGTARRIYLNGQLLVSDQPTGRNSTGNSFAIGATNNFSERFMGLLDDVAIYSRALTATEIAQLASGAGSGITVTSTSSNFGTPLALTTSGGQGAGAVTYEVVSAGGAGCSIVGTTLTSTSGGTCTIKATKAADQNYESSTSPDTVVTINRIAQSGAITVTSTAATAGVSLALTATGGSGTGTFTYAVVSAGTANCSIQGTSLVTTSSGTCTVTGTRGQDSNYTAATSATTTITVTKQTPTYSTYTIADRRYLGAGFTLTAPVSTSNGTFTWSSSNTAVASVNTSTGAVTINGVGVAIITATQASTAMYSSGAVTAELTVLPAIPTYGAFSVPAKTYGDAAFTISAVSSNSPAAITYTSSDTSVATIDSATRTITIVGPGSTTISASQLAQGNYDAGSSTAILNVSRVTPTLTAFGADSGSGAGLKGTRYVGYFADNVNWFTTATPHGDTNQLTNFARFSSSPNFNNSAENYSWQWIGAFKASTSGSYTFCTNSDDASYIWIGDVAKTGFTTGNSLVNNGGGHGMREICANITLVGGTMYPMRVQYGEGGGGDEMQMRFVPPGGSSTHEGAGYYYAGMGITKAEGDVPFTPTLPTSNSPGAFTYSSSDTAVATINETTGLVTVVGRGTTTLTATQAASGTWGSTSTQTEMRVLRRATVGSFTIPSGLTFASAPFTPTAPTSDSPGAWSYESSNSAVAGWDSASGQISLSAAGTTTITAVQAETGEFAESRVSTTLTLAGETVVGIDSGERHSCAVTQTGGVVCWGYNNYGQLGDGTTTNRSYPVAVSGITSGAVKVVTSLWHSCALMSNGTMKCWGRGEWGQLGNNAYSTSYTPVNVGGITDASDIGITGYTSCAIVSLGALKCWGFNGNGWGLVGNNSDSNVPSPITVPSLTSGVTSVAGGEGTVCATVDTGALKCWGRNEWGNLGDGTATHRKVPTDVIGLPGGATSVSPGQYSTCAVAGAGGVYCWGYNDYGMLGNGNNSQYIVPVQVSGLTSGWKSVVMGERNACAVSQAGSLRCWGRNDWGNLGVGNTSWSNVPVTPTGLSSGVRQVSVGWYFMCALLTTGSVKCSGYNGDYELGDKTSTQRTTAVSVAGLQTPIITDPDTQLSGVTLSVTKIRRDTPPFTFTAATSNRPDEITYTSTNTFVATVDAATRTVTIVGAGTAFVKASVPANATQSAAVTYTKISVPDVEYVQVSTSYYSSCGLTRIGGVKCWGNSDWGQLGNGTSDRRYVPTDVSDLTTGVAEVATGYHHACALTTAGGVMCWGLNDYGQIGFGTTSIRPFVPVGVTGLSSGIIQIDAGYQHTCALTATGGVKCWGLNNYGQLGDGTTESRTTPVDVVGLTSGVVEIDLGHEFSCARLDTGAVKCWGYNGFGQLGDGTTTNRFVPRSATGVSGATDISSGFHHSCAVLAGGEVRCWGYNGFGQLGDNSTANRTTSVAVSGVASGAIRVVAGGYHTCVITSTGAMKCWGRNDNGELGDGTTTRRYVPVDVTGLSAGVIEVSAANGHSTCAIVANDALKCWGYNDWGQVGNLSTGNVLTPTDVVSAYVTTGRSSTTLGTLGLPGSGYTTSSPGFTLVAPTSNRTISSSSCAAGGLCNVGDVGPGGGRVFYVSKGFAALGTACGSECTYLEAAPITWAGGTDDPRVSWSGNTNTAIGSSARGTAVGSGFGNTTAMIAQSAVTNRAATLARAYAGGGFTDWYLPSTDELRQLYLKRDTVGSLSCGEWYQASTEYDAGSRWLQHPCQDSTAITGKGDSRYVRPIRAFGPVNTDAPLTYSSSDPSVATVNRWTGAVTITGAGSAVLAATHGGSGEARLSTSRVTLSVVTSCADGGPCGQGETPPVGGTMTDCQRGIVCSIGDTGPGGGKVFFVDTNDDHVGFDYLELAATESTANWCNTASANTSLSGAGDNAQGINNMQSILAACATGAATAARAFTNGSKTDWYLPAPAELSLVKTNLVDPGLLSGLSGDYWTSRQYDSTRAYTVDPVTGVQTYASKSDTRVVRPIRAFSGKGAVTINATLTGFALPASSYVFGTAPFNTTAPTSLNPGILEYSSSNTAVATIDRYSGTVTIIGAGSTTFTASKLAFGSYAARTQTASFTVTKATPTISGFTAPGGPYRADDANFTMVAPTVSTSDAGALTYTSSNSSIATIDASTRVVDLLAAGTVTLTASVPGGANWNGASATYALNVGALCKDGGVCRIGDEGPGGGTVFLLDTNNEYPTIDFMEIAPADASSSAAWCPAGTTQPTTGKTVGRGAGNTAAILAANSACAAAAAADGYSTNTQTDWFLPSKTEFDLAVTNLAAVGVTLPAGTYWTSSGGVDATGATSSASLPATSGVANVPGLGTTYVDTSTSGGGWKLVGYAENGSIGKLFQENGTFDAATRTGSANLDVLQAIRGANEMAISWTGASGSLPTGGIMSYDYAVSFPLPAASSMTMTGTASTPPTYNWTSASFSLSGSSPDQSLVTLTELKGTSGLPSQMYMRNKTFGVDYGGSYGLVSNPGINQQLDWNPDGQAFSALYLRHNGLNGFITPSGTGSGYTPRTVAIWVRNTPGVVLSVNNDPCAATKSRVGSDIVLTFSNPGTCRWTPPAGVSSASVLVVAGGGGAGGGGGGGGGVRYDSARSLSGAVDITVGMGGLGTLSGEGNVGLRGASSAFGSLAAIGGGGGGNYLYEGTSGGSGGGNGQDRTGAGPAGATGQGNAGGTSNCDWYGGGGGGGGAGGVGQNGGPSSGSPLSGCSSLGRNDQNPTYGGDGGVGLAHAISGTSTYYGGGGGGGVNTNAGPLATGSSGLGGLGGGGFGALCDYCHGTNGTDGLGGGGGGGDAEGRGGNGGHGTVIVRYAALADSCPVTSSTCAITMTSAGSADTAMTTATAKVRAVRSWQRRESCKDIKETTGTNANGVYAINVNNGGVIVPTQAYCLMDSAMGGGGWTMIMKAAQNSTTFPYSSSYWTTANTLNTSSLDLTSTDAKMSTFNILQGTQMLAIFPDIDASSFGTTERGSIDGHNYGWTWRTNIPSGPKTALSIFQGPDEQFVQDALTFDGYRGAIWSSQADIRFYGFNWNDNLKARWGFGWNENGGGLWPNGAKGSDDTSGGIGLQSNNWSAGDVLNCCNNTVGLRRSMAVQIFIK